MVVKTDTSGREVVRPLLHSGEVNSVQYQPSALMIAAGKREVLEAILDALAPTFAEPGPRFLREHDGAWRRMLLIPVEWVVHDVGPIAPQVYEAARTAYLLGAVEAHVITHEVSSRPLRRLSAATEPT